MYLVLNDTIAGFAHEFRRKLDHHQVLFKIEIIFTIVWCKYC